MKKRIISLLLCLAMSVVALAGCAGTIEADSEYKGQQITMYLTENIYNLDPAYAYQNEISRSIVSLIFDTLFTVDNSGKVSPSLAKGYRTETDKDGNFFMYIDIREDAKWSDNNPVTADDVVFAWKRLLNPKNSFEAAALLFDIKGARDYNQTGEGKDTMGISADQKLLTIEFEKEIDVEQFVLNLTSLALAPLREDIVGESKETDRQTDDWAKKPGIMAASGPFKLTKVGYYANGEIQYVDANYSVKQVDSTNKVIVDKNGNPVYMDAYEEDVFTAQEVSSYMLERNLYYYRNAEDGENLDASVTPYRIIVDCSLTDKEILDGYNAGIITYIGDIPMSIRNDVKDDAHVSDSLSTNVCYLNEEANVTRTLSNGTQEAVKLFANQTVRQVLSMAIDRQKIAEQIVFADAATGLVPTGVYDSNNIKKLFRDSSESYEFLTKKSVADLKAMLTAADIVPSEYSFTITVSSYDEVHALVANALVDAWGKSEGGLGFDVSVKVRGTIANNDVHKDVAGVPTDLCDDLWAEDIQNRNYQAAVLDLVAPSADPFSVLAPFAAQFSGQAMDMSDVTEYKATPHVTGYNSDNYNQILEDAFAEKDVTKRASLLHKAEKELMNDMPVIPIVFNKNAYMINEDVLNLNNKVLFWDSAAEYYHPVSFRKAEIRDYEKYEAQLAKYIFDNYNTWKERPDSYFGITFADIARDSFVYINSNYLFLFKDKYGLEGYDWLPKNPADDKGKQETEVDTEDSTESAT